MAFRLLKGDAAWLRMRMGEHITNQNNLSVLKLQGKTNLAKQF
jgi:hypothetical protein